MNVFALDLPEVKLSLKEAASLVSEALAASTAFDISAQTESLELLAEVLTQASSSFYFLCSDGADCHGCFLSRDIVPALTGLLDCATKELCDLTTGPHRSPFKLMDSPFRSQSGLNCIQTCRESCRSQEMDKPQREQLLDRVLSVLALLQRMSCLAVWQQLRPYFKTLAGLLCFCCDDQDQASKVPATLLRFRRSVDMFSFQSSLYLSGQVYRFVNDVRNVSWNGELDGSKNSVCVLLHIVLCKLKASDRVCDQLQHRWLNELQEAAVHDDELLPRLWGCAASILQEDLFVSWMCNVESHPHQGKIADKGPEQLASCFQAALLSIGEYLPDSGIATAHSGLHTLMTCHARTSCTPYQVVASLFLKQESIPGAFRGLCLMAGMNYKGCMAVIESLGNLCTPELQACLLDAIIGWAAPDQQAPINCRLACLKGYVALTKRGDCVLDSALLAQHAAGLKCMFSQEQSVRIRRAAFTCWISLLQSASGDTPFLSLENISTVHCLVERCTDRDSEIQAMAFQTMSAIPKQLILQSMEVGDCYNIIFHAASHPLPVVHRHAAALVLALLKACSNQTRKCFLASATESLSRMKDSPHTHLLAELCADLFVDCMVDPKHSTHIADESMMVHNQ